MCWSNGGQIIDWWSLLYFHISYIWEWASITEVKNKGGKHDQCVEWKVVCLWCLSPIGVCNGVIWLIVFDGSNSRSTRTRKIVLSLMPLKCLLNNSWWEVKARKPSTDGDWARSTDPQPYYVAQAITMLKYGHWSVSCAQPTVSRWVFLL